MSENKLICIPELDTTKRFLLGQHGKKELLAIGLNPSTANEQRLDPTSRNIKTIAQNNGFDGWWLTNLYPHRTPKPSELPKKDHLKPEIKYTTGLNRVTFCQNSGNKVIE